MKFTEKNMILFTNLLCDIIYLFFCCCMECEECELERKNMEKKLIYLYIFRLVAVVKHK